MDNCLKPVTQLQALQGHTGDLPFWNDFIVPEPDNLGEHHWTTHRTFRLACAFFVLLSGSNDLSKWVYKKLRPSLTARSSRIVVMSGYALNVTSWYGHPSCHAVLPPRLASVHAGLHLPISGDWTRTCDGRLGQGYLLPDRLFGVDATVI